MRTGLDASKAKLEVFEREKVELIGTLATVSKEWEQKNHKIAAERKKEMTSIEGKISELQAEVVKLTDRNTLLSADKVLCVYVPIPTHTTPGQICHNI